MLIEIIELKKMLKKMLTTKTIENKRNAKILIEISRNENKINCDLCNMTTQQLNWRIEKIKFSDLRKNHSTKRMIRILILKI